MTNKYEELDLYNLGLVWYYRRRVKLIIIVSKIGSMYGKMEYTARNHVQMTIQGPKADVHPVRSNEHVQSPGNNYVSQFSH